MKEKNWIPINVDLGDWFFDDAKISKVRFMPYNDYKNHVTQNQSLLDEGYSQEFINRNTFIVSPQDNPYVKELDNGQYEFNNGRGSSKILGI